MNENFADGAPGLAPFSLRDAPAFIERQFPVGWLSAEAYKEREGGRGQTLPALGSYWKGRKPLILVRAVVLGCLLPATEDAAADLGIFLRLMAMDDAAFGRRFDGGAGAFARLFPAHADLVTEDRGRRVVWRNDLAENEREARIAEAFASLPYAERLKHVRRPEECDEVALLAPVWPEVNRHLGTNARSIPELVEQLGVARFGHRPKLADTFCGGGSIPFEAARIGCDVYASDLNPVACMLTWGAFHIIGASKEKRAEIERTQKEVAASVDAEITRLGIERDSKGNRAKAYLYCLETRCPKTGWMVPMAPSWVISKTRNVVAKLVPDPAWKRYEIEIHAGVTAAEMAEAEEGTVREGRLVHAMNPERSGVEIKTIRGDYRDADGNTRNRLRLWEKSDFVPRHDDIFQERLYCVQWITRETLGRGRQETFFAAVTADDLTRERKVETIVGENLARWQDEGLVPDMPIEPGDKTDEPIRTRGWTHWHHLFGARDVLFLGMIRKFSAGPCGVVALAKQADFSSRLVRWDYASLTAINAMYNQALNSNWNWLSRSSFIFTSGRNVEYKNFPLPSAPHVVETLDAKRSVCVADLLVTDPPLCRRNKLS